MRRLWVTAALPAVLLAAPVAAADKDELAPPFKVEVAGKPLDVEGVGYAAPFVADFDGDRVKDLLVGQFTDGKLRVYRNEGTDEKPKFAKFTWFLDGKPEGRVPTG
jgi:hypothetical protein